MSIISLNFTQSEYQTLGEYLNQEGLSPVFSYFSKPKEFLDYKRGENELTNFDIILSSYKTKLERDSAQAQYNLGQYLDIRIKAPLTFFINSSNVNAQDFLAENNASVVTPDINYFISKKLANLYENPLYRGVFKKSQLGSIKTLYPQLSVVLWSRVLETYIDITPFIISCNMFNAIENGGNFNITLPPIAGIYRDGVGWTIDKNSINGFSEDGVGRDFTAQSHLFKDSVGSLSNFYFEKVIRANDLIFIRHETLAFEYKERAKNSGKYKLSSSDIPNKNYDMIGMVDLVSRTSSFESNDLQIQVSGRDLIKVIIDDGAYFFPEEYATNIFSNEVGSDKKLSKRIFGKLEVLAAYSYRSIEYSLKFIINQLSNTGYYPNNIFDGYRSLYGEKQLYVFDEIGTQRAEERHNKRIENTKANIKNARKEYGLPTNDASINGAYNLIINYWLSKLKSNPNTPVPKESDIVPKEFESVLYVNRGSDFDRTLNRFILDESVYLSSLGGYYIAKHVTSNTGQKFKADAMQGVWQIINLLVDDQVRNLRIADSSISTQSGSLLNFFKQVCQIPFVEFYTDTIYDQYYLIAKRPAWNRQSVLDAIKGKTLTSKEENFYVLPSNTDIDTASAQIKLKGQGVGDNNDAFVLPELVIGQSKTTQIDGYVINVEAEDVINENIMMNDGQAYSWYRIQPRGLFFGEGSKVALAYLPIIYFPKYVDVFGSRPLDYTTNYIPYLPMQGVSSLKNQSEFERQVFYDLKFMIDSHAHLPFTRSGTITINRDRRIKVNTFVRYKPTGEIFLVTAVSHNTSISDTSIESTTTITIERGMVERFIEGIEVEGVKAKYSGNNNVEGLGNKVSYFNVVNTFIDENRFNNTNNVTIDSDGKVVLKSNLNNDIVSNWKVNDEIFNFFLQNRQFTNAGIK